MSYKIIGYFVTLLTVARAGIIGPGAAAVAVAQQPAATIIRTENYDTLPRYSFGYSVADGLTGDNKAQEETRNGDVVRGTYSLIEPDGARRVVSYLADPVKGFNAIVQRAPSGIPMARTAVATAPSVGAPSVITTAAPTAVQPQTTLLNVPLVRQPFVSGLAATNVVTANSDLVNLGASLGIQSGSVYGTHAILADGFSGDNIVKIN